MRVMALDYGTKRIGVAVSDEGRALARPLKSVRASGLGPALAALAPSFAEFAPAEVVVGVPVRLGGGDGEHAPAARRLAAAVEKRFGVPVALRDEALTTAEAMDRMRAAGVRRVKRAALSDAAAAAVLLQGYLDERR